MVADEVEGGSTEQRLEICDRQGGLGLVIKFGEREIISRKGAELFTTVLAILMVVMDAVFCDLMKRMQLSIYILCSVSSVVTVYAHCGGEGRYKRAKGVVAAGNVVSPPYLYFLEVYFRASLSTA